MVAREWEVESVTDLIRLLGFLHTKLGMRSLLIKNEDYWIDTPEMRLQSAYEIMRLREGLAKGV